MSRRFQRGHVRANHHESLDRSRRRQKHPSSL